MHDSSVQDIHPESFRAHINNPQNQNSSTLEKSFELMILSNNGTC